MKNLILWPVAVFFALTACAGRVVKQEELATVHKVAIVGFDLQQQKPVSSEDLVGMALKSKPSQEPTPRMRTEATHVEPVYQDLSQKLAADTGWKVISLAEVKRNPEYTKLFKDKTEGFQNRPMVNGRYDLFQAPGLLDSFAIITTKKERLTALARALGVDALVYASSTINLNNNSAFASMVGKGEFRPNSDLSLFVIDARSGEKIFVNAVRGPQVDVGAKNVVGMADEEHLNRLARQATGLSTDLVLKDLSLKR